MSFSGRGNKLRTVFEMNPKGIDDRNSCNGCFRFNCELLRVQQLHASTMLYKFLAMCGQ